MEDMSDLNSQACSQIQSSKDELALTANRLAGELQHRTELVSSSVTLYKMHCSGSRPGSKCNRTI